MELPKTNTSPCSNDRTSDVRYAYDTLKSLRQDWLSITITSPEKSEGRYVLTATTGSSEGTEMLLWSDEWPTTSMEALVGLFLKE